MREYKKCSLCPKKRVCRDDCYGETPCDFALAFDKVARRLDLKTVCIESLHQELLLYRECFGEIIFPNQVQLRKQIYDAPAGWMYSLDCLHWKSVPEDISQVDSRALFRRIPEGVVVGVNDDIKKNPSLYTFSVDNGYSWKDLEEGDTWIYHGSHGSHAATWFKKRVIERV